MAQGYLAAIYRSVPVTVGAEERHQLLSNPSFETGDTTGWTTSGTVTVELGGRWGHGLAHVAKVVDTGTGAGVEQTVTLDDALTAATQCLFRCWAKFSAGKTGTLRVTFLDAMDNPIGSPVIVTMNSTSRYPINGWGLWSVRCTAPIDTKKITYEATTTSAQTWYLDDCVLVLLRQILGATGDLTSGVSITTADVTTFASAQADGGWRRFFPTLAQGEQITIRTFWSTDDDYTFTGNDEIYVVLYHNTATHLRDEFWGKVIGQTGRFPLEAVVERDLNIQITSDVGTTDTVADV